VTTARQFLDRLVTEGLISEEESRRLPEEYKEDTFPILAHLIKKGVVQHAELGKLWGDFIGFPYVDLSKTLFQYQIVEILPDRFARKHKIILMYQFGDAITAAMKDPGNALVVEEVARITKSQISPVFAFPEEIEEAIDIQYQSTDSVMEVIDKIDLDKFMEATREVSLAELQRIAGDEAIIEFTRRLLMLGIKERASDIHIEPGEGSIRVRYRIDGVLQERLTLDKNLLAPLVSRIKVIAGVNIVEKRRPQDGRITFSLPNRSIDLRFSTVPTICGEKIVLRILGQAQMRDVPDLTELYFSTTALSKLEKVIDTPNGVFL
jgi:type IV pilus assembly protein PilB